MNNYALCIERYRQMATLLNAGVSHQEISKRYGVSKSTVYVAARFFNLSCCWHKGDHVIKVFRDIFCAVGIEDELAQRYAWEVWDALCN